MISDSSMKSHAKWALQRRLLVELAWAAASPPLCMSFASCLVTYMLGLPGLLCPEGTVWFFILHKQHLIIRGFFLLQPSFRLPSVLLCCGALLDEGFWNSSHTCSFKEWLFLCPLVFLRQAGGEGRSLLERIRAPFSVQWDSGCPGICAYLLTALQELSDLVQWQFSSSPYTTDAEGTTLLKRTILGTARDRCAE